MKHDLSSTFSCLLHVVPFLQSCTFLLHEAGGDFIPAFKNTFIYYKNKHSRVIQLDFPKKSCTYPSPSKTNKQQKQKKKTTGPRILNQPRASHLPQTSPCRLAVTTLRSGCGTCRPARPLVWWLPWALLHDPSGWRRWGWKLFLNFSKFAAWTFWPSPKKERIPDLDLPDM